MEPNALQQLLNSVQETPEQPSREWLDVFERRLAMAAELYRQEVTELATVAYLEGLRSLSASALNAAWTRALKTCSFMPTVADILKASEMVDPAPLKYNGCQRCHGMRWITVLRDGYGKAVKCGCA